jgi:YD repeat-containing protein
VHTKTTRPTGQAPSVATNMKAMAGLAIMLAVLMPTKVLAQSRTFYDASGRVTGRSATGSNGSTTIYDASGRVTGRTSTSGSQTTIYGSDGRRVGTVTTQTGK